MNAPGFKVTSPCGREWFVPESAVIGDYATYLEEQDRLSKADAQAQALAECDVECWFAEQFRWTDVKTHGVLIKSASAEDIERALDAYQDRAGNVMDNFEAAVEPAVSKVSPDPQRGAPDGTGAESNVLSLVIDLINHLSTGHGEKQIFAFAAELKLRLRSTIAAAGVQGNGATRETALRYKHETDSLREQLHAAEAELKDYKNGPASIAARAKTVDEAIAVLEGLCRIIADEEDAQYVVLQRGIKKLRTLKRSGPPDGEAEPMGGRPNRTKKAKK
jgi:hypothetical protein